jgi:hypothetical protein
MVLPSMLNILLVEALGGWKSSAKFVDHNLGSRRPEHGVGRVDKVMTRPPDLVGKEEIHETNRVGLGVFYRAIHRQVP